jgi:hypothetical protein
MIFGATRDKSIYFFVTDHGAFLRALARKNRAIRSNLFCPPGKKGFPLLSLAPHGLIVRYAHRSLPHSTRFS